MRLVQTLLALYAVGTAAASSAFIDSTAVYIQPVGSSSISLLADVHYNPSTLAAEIESYEAPDIPEDAEFVRIGIYDKSTKSWTSSISVTSVESFEKGYSPTIVLSLASPGELLGVTFKSGMIDAGQTRDFGPKVKVVKTMSGKKVELNRPVVLSKEGKLEPEVVEKTFLQRYARSFYLYSNNTNCYTDTGGQY